MRARHLSTSDCCVADVVFEDRGLQGEALAGVGTGSARDLGGDFPAEIDNRVAHPLRVHLLAGDHVLVGIVELVVADGLRAFDVTVHQSQAIAIELLQESELFRSLHAFCFSLQVMHTRVHGIALSRATAIGSPQSRQVP